MLNFLPEINRNQSLLFGQQVPGTHSNLVLTEESSSACTFSQTVARHLVPLVIEEARFQHEIILGETAAVRPVVQSGGEIIQCRASAIGTVDGRCVINRANRHLCSNSQQSTHRAVP